MHGFPDDSRIYDRVAPLLAPRWVVAVDWLGSAMAARIVSNRFPFDGAWHQSELRAVLDSLELGQVGSVAHDASGPDAIDVALGAPDRVGQVILLNTYYGHAPALRLAEMIQLLPDPALRRWPTPWWTTRISGCGYWPTPADSSAWMRPTSKGSGRLDRAAVLR